MAYATQDDIVSIYSDDALYVAERDGSVAADAVVLALDFASSEIDSFIGTRYPLPIMDPPLLLKQFCVDIALYRLASTRDLLTEEHRQRYEDAKDHLYRVSQGKATLPIDVVDGDESAGGDQPRPIVSGGPEREFTRAKMRDF